jgi:hypothetical protein
MKIPSNLLVLPFLIESGLIMPQNTMCHVLLAAEWGKEPVL